MATQQLYTDRVKGPHPRHAFGGFAKQLANTVFHFARGLVGKGHRQNTIVPHPSHPQQMRDARGQRLGFASASTRQHQYRTIQRLDRLALSLVQFTEIVGGLCMRHTRPLRQGNGGLKGVIF